ncbi:MAG: hypothetical protein WCO05_02735 [Candidatus Moraniibacteriota bacterium]
MQIPNLFAKLNNRICPKLMKRETATIIYKLLHDSLFMLLVFFILTLIAEAVLPGIIISHIGFSKIIIIILFNVFLLRIFAKKITPEKVSVNTSPQKKESKKIIISFILLGALLIFNSQLEMNVFLNLFFLLACLGIGYLSYQILFHEE